MKYSESRIRRLGIQAAGATGLNLHSVKVMRALRVWAESGGKQRCVPVMSDSGFELKAQCKV